MKRCGSWWEESRASRKELGLLDGGSFAHLLLERYEALDPECKAQVPLRKVWVPKG